MKMSKKVCSFMTKKEEIMKLMDCHNLQYSKSFRKMLGMATWILTFLPDSYIQKLKSNAPENEAPSLKTRNRNKYFYMARFFLIAHLAGMIFAFDATILNSIFFTLSYVWFCLAGVLTAMTLYALSFVIERHNSLSNQRRFYSYVGLFVLSQAIFHFAVNQL